MVDTLQVSSLSPLLRDLLENSSDPYFGEIQPQASQKFTSKSQGVKGRLVSLSTSTQKETPESGSCLCCGNADHRIWKCSKFKQLGAKEKKKLVFDKRLCYACLHPGHMAQDCRWRHTCGECKGTHPTSMHDVEAKTKPSPKCETPGGEMALSRATRQNSGPTSSTSMIVPVLLSSAGKPCEEIPAYALLDSQSDSTFILEELAEEWCLPRRPVHLQLGTMASQDFTSVQCNSVSNLMVRGINRSQKINIHQAYTRSFIPVDRNSIPTQFIAENWPHLKHLSEEMRVLLNCQVGLLIGYDCPSALAPLDVVHGSLDEPFAVKICLG
jgi:hypothetical protein